MKSFILNSDRLALSDKSRDAYLLSLAERIKISPIKNGERAWIHIATTGEFKERNFSLSRSDLDRMVDNFNAQPNSRPAFRGHADLYDDGAPAVGHILALARDGEDLWGLIDFLPDFAKSIRKGEYVSCSIYFATNGRDKKTGANVGALLYSLGMTNVPYLDGLTPIALSENEDGSQIRFYLSEKNGANESMSKQALDETTETGEEKPAEDEATPEAEMALEQMISAMKEAMEQEELDAAGAVAVLRDPRIQEALKALAKGEDAESTLPVEEGVSQVAASEAIKALSELRTENKKLEEKIAKLEKKSLDDELDKAIALGKIKPMEKELFRCVALSNRTLFDKTVGERAEDPKMKTVSGVALSDMIQEEQNANESEFAKNLKQRVNEIISKSK